jgi:hypothetical protein
MYKETYISKREDVKTRDFENASAFMLANSIYWDLREVQKLLWEDDDRISQGNLFDAQNRLSEIMLVLADVSDHTDELLKTFPWLYKTKD